MKEIKQVTVMGAGIMGPGIAEILTIAGCTVRLYDIVPEALEKAKAASTRTWRCLWRRTCCGRSRWSPCSPR